MLILNWKESVKKALDSKWFYKESIDIDLLVDWVNLSVLDLLNSKPQESELWLFKFWNDPRSFVSFKQKIKYSLKNWIKINFNHLPISSDWINRGIEIIDTITNRSNSKIIVQLPFSDRELIERIQKLSISQDIDNLKQDENRFWCTQLAILWLTKIVVKNFNISSITIIWSNGFIWKWVFELCNNFFPGIKLKGIDINDDISQPEKEFILSNTDLLISTSSNVIDLPNDIKKWLCVIDCWLIKWKLWNRWSIPIRKDNYRKYNFLL